MKLKTFSRTFYVYVTSTVSIKDLAPFLAARLIHDSFQFGSLFFCVCSDSQRNVPPMPLEKLKILESVKEITQYLLIQSLDHANITSLYFLSNLEKIVGRKTDM